VVKPTLPASCRLSRRFASFAGNLSVIFLILILAPSAPAHPIRTSFAEADFRPETVFETVGEAGRRVDHHRARIDFDEKAPRTAEMFGDDGIGVLRPVLADVSDGFVEIADDEAERQRGLMFRPPLDQDRGMLFQFPIAQEQAFWMKNTPSSLDIIYIDPTGRIISIASHATPYSEVPLPSNGAANGVLELRAGRAEEIGAVPGSTVRHPFFKP
jgi:uncharacterized membrane protein (UPF0127 family)